MYTYMNSMRSGLPDGMESNYSVPLLTTRINPADAAVIDSVTIGRHDFDQFEATAARYQAAGIALPAISLPGFGAILQLDAYPLELPPAKGSSLTGHLHRATSSHGQARLDLYDSGAAVRANLYRRSLVSKRLGLGVKLYVYPRPLGQ